MNFKEFVMSQDLPEEQKAAIINKHVEEEREILSRTDAILSKVKGENELIRNSAMENKRRYEELLEQNRRCVDECRGALAAASAMLEGFSGTHQMKHYQAQSVARWIRTVRQELIEIRYNGNPELPF